jgi:hypothetical protein
MRLVSAALIAASLAASAVSAVAAPARIDDTQFLVANRCLGLMTSHALGTPDAAAMRRFVEDQSWGRVSFVYDRADQMRDDARRAAERNDTDLRTRLTAERDGVCRHFLIPQTTTSSGRGDSRSIR